MKLRLRLCGRRLLSTWLCLLRIGAVRIGPGAIPPGEPFRVQQNFQRLHREWQAESARIFRPYHHFCPECGSLCCREPEVPFSALDHLLWSGPGGQTGPDSAQAPAKIEFFPCFKASFLYRKLKRFTGADRLDAEPGEESARSHCPALTATGCQLPWGERPIICVFCVCPLILQDMDFGHYRNYLWINLKYLFNLSRFLWWLKSGPAVHG
jgi:hypothetical protein